MTRRNHGVDVLTGRAGGVPWIAVCYHRVTSPMTVTWHVASLSLEWPPHLGFDRVDGRVVPTTPTSYDHE